MSQTQGKTIELIKI